MRENARLEFDKKLDSGDISSTDAQLHEMAESCEGKVNIL